MSRVPEDYDGQLAGLRDRYWGARPVGLNPMRGADILSDRCRDAERLLIEARLRPSRRALAKARRIVELVEGKTRAGITHEEARAWLGEGRAASGWDERYRESEKRLGEICGKANEDFALARGESAAGRDAA